MLNAEVHFHFYLCTLFRVYLRKTTKTNSISYKTNSTTNSEYRTKNEVLYYEIYHVYAVRLRTFPPRSTCHWATRKIRGKFV